MITTCSAFSYCQHCRGLGFVIAFLVLPAMDTFKYILYGNLSARGGTSAYHMEVLYPASEDFADNATWPYCFSLQSADAWV